MLFKKYEMSIVYTIWAGVGTALVAIVGMLFFNESISLLKILFILMIIGGVVGLELID